MLHLPLFPGLRPVLFSLLVFASATGLRSQSTDGSTLQEKPGLALIKPQPWSKPEEATVYEFQAFYDRSTTGAGYYEFHKDTLKRQVATGRLVKVVLYPDPSQTKDVVGPADRQKIFDTIEELKGVKANFPATSTYLDPSIKKMSEELALYDAGKVKKDGTWISKTTYDADQATNLINLLKTDVVNADPPSTFDFNGDPKVDALKKLAATNPSIKKSLDDITTTYNKALRKEKRNKLLARLADPALPLSEAKTAVAQLKALQPDEDPAKSAIFIKSWDTAFATMTAAMAQASTLAPLIEKELSGVQIKDAPPVLSPDLAKQIAALNETLKQFIAARPAPQLIAASGRGLAVGSIGLGFDKLKGDFADRQFFDAREIIDDLARQSRQVGPETTRVVVSLQGYIAGKIKEFTDLREEAKLLAESGKPAEALVKYQAAYDLIPDSGVSDSINQLKLALPSPSPAKK
ncbi:hypothetical protein BH09VER1_BH09VER1_25010 [soil metagenome]